MQYRFVLLFLLAFSLFNVVAQEVYYDKEELIRLVRSIEQPQNEEVEDAVKVLIDYLENDSLQNAIYKLKDFLNKTDLGNSVSVLEKELENSTGFSDNEFYLRQLKNYFLQDEVYEWLKNIQQDSVEFSLQDVLGNEVTLWTNSEHLKAKRFFLHKSSLDSLGFWLHSLPSKSIMLVPDFDIYQESYVNNQRNLFVTTIPVQENMESRRLSPFRKYRKYKDYWKRGMITNIGFSQAYLENWVLGGESSIAARSDLSLFAEYKKNKTIWENLLRWKYGIMKSKDNEDFRRNEDILEFNTKLALQAHKRWYYSSTFSLRSQLFNGYKYLDNEDRNLASSMLAPGYFILSVGMDYKPQKKHLSLHVSPLSAKLTAVLDSKIDEKTYGLEEGKRTRRETGAYMKIGYEKKLMKSVGLKTNLELFSNYEGKAANVDMDWETTLNLKINYYMTTRISIHAKYDDDVEIPIYENVNGVETQVGTGQRLQLNENLSVGVVFQL